MARQSGLGDNIYVGGYDLSGDVGSLQRIGGGPAAMQLTGINASAIERIGGKRDGGIDFNSWFNDTAGQAHPVLSALPAADVIVSYYRGNAIGNACANLTAKQINYDGTRAEDGSLKFAVNAAANSYGLEWGVQLTAGKRTDIGATNGSSLDQTAIGQTLLGGQAYLQVFSFTGTDVTITIEDSTDDAAWATLASFTQVVSAPTTERIATSSSETVDQYLRIATTTSGGFSSLVFAVGFSRNLTATVF